MASDGFDFKELTDFEEEILELAKEFNNGKEAKKFLRESGTKLKNKTLKAAKRKVKKRTGNLFKGIARGKPYKYKPENSTAIRVYGGSPAHHVHLLNSGHIVVRNGKEVGFAKGHHFFEDAAKEHEGEHYKDTQAWIDELISKHGLG